MHSVTRYTRELGETFVGIFFWDPVGVAGCMISCIMHLYHLVYHRTYGGVDLSLARTPLCRHKGRRKAEKGLAFGSNQSIYRNSVTSLLVYSYCNEGAGSSTVHLRSPTDM